MKKIILYNIIHFFCVLQWNLSSNYLETSASFKEPNLSVLTELIIQLIIQFNLNLPVQSRTISHFTSGTQTDNWFYSALHLHNMLYKISIPCFWTIRS